MGRAAGRRRAFPSSFSPFQFLTCASSTVQLNRLACLRLTERCAEILISVRAEVVEAGLAAPVPVSSVGVSVNVGELEVPLARLVECVYSVFVFVF